MPYYHVLIETYEFDKKYYELDKTDLSEIKEEVILPFLKGEQFLFGGRILHKTEIKYVLIKESECTSEEFANSSASTSGIRCLPLAIVRSAKYTKNITRRILNECESQMQEVTNRPKVLTPNKPKAPMDKSKVFIVHGHDGEAKEAVARFVEKIGLEAIILHEQASSGNTIIEKIEANSNVGFAIVLYTPCDMGASKGEKDQLKPRARQNVIFEHGYLIGKIGRKNVCALVKGDIETPTDISGVVYIKMDEGDSWKYAVAKEMKACGYEVDLNKI